MPGLAAAMMLTVTGCGSDDEDASSGASSAEGQDADRNKDADGDEDGNEDADGNKDDEEPAGNDRAKGGEDAETPTEQPGNGKASGDGEAAGDGKFNGLWLTQSHGEETAVLLVDDGQVLFGEDQTAEGDTCTGTIAAAKLTVTCKQQGSNLWPGTEATVATHNERAIYVTWAGGTKQGFFRSSDDIHDVNDNVRRNVAGIEAWLKQR